MTRMNHYRVETHLHTHGTGASVVLERYYEYYPDNIE